jgi:O-antigen/teichoic acid export membrane protein
MTRERGIYGATLWNLAGNVVPLAVGLYAIPRLITGMGETRFGVLTLLWALIGYFGIFDLGLGRAITQAVAEAAGRKRDAEVPDIYWTGTLVLAGLGAVGMAALLMGARPLLLRVLSVPAALRGEFQGALTWVAIGVPFVTIASASRGLLEGEKRFTAVNIIRIPYGVATFALPLLWPGAMASLGTLAAQLVLLRVVVAVLQYVACRPSLRGTRLRVSKPMLLRLFRFGGWMTLTNMVSPLMSYMDRFVIGALVSVSVVAYYTTPHELVMRLLIIPGALATTLFPVFGRGLVEDSLSARSLYQRSARLMAVLLMCVCTVVSAFGYDALSWWLGRAFADQARVVLVLLTIGVWFNGLAYLPYALLQGAGNSRATALTHLAECIIYMPVLVLLVKRVGINGAAVAWALRALVDLVLLEWQARRCLGAPYRWGRVVVIVIGAVALGVVACMPSAWARGTVLLVACMIAVSLLTTRLAPDGRRGAAPAGPA